ncbi:MAG: L-threonylcarbamoyladenylate synthase [Candidatus Marsarchaeota archaeon]|nr:L-threonylcarbamoyladenylate synthase [Candidatus Marsarchaeota archaeon]MCL5413328.1 L-threonylcarbamoyladenylate synthase [Candidatus Marsarchaeota archaeon]
MTIMLNIDPRNPDKAKIAKAADIIRRGGIVVFPTETVYGIGANALNPKACRKIYAIKGRAADNPLIVHVSSMDMADAVAKIPDKYKKILKRIWPCPLTIVAKARDSVPKVVTGGLNTVSVRMPQNRVALRLIEESGVPIAAPSANISKRPSSTRASHAKKYFDGAVDAIIDAGSSRFGIESTIIDTDNFMLLRPGAFTSAQIEKEFGKKPRITEESLGLKYAQRPKSPGTKYAHYSPLTPLFLFDGDAKSLKRITSVFKGKFVFIGSSESCMELRKNAKKAISLGKKRGMREIAHNLFHSLILLDSLNADFAIIEGFPEHGMGLAIMNRLRKASGNRSFESEKELRILVGGHG